MDYEQQQFGGGSWSMIPNIPNNNQNQISNQDSLFLSPNHHFQQQQQFNNNLPLIQQQQQQVYQSPQHQQQQQFHQSFVQQSPQQQQQQQFHQQFVQVTSPQQQQQQQFVQVTSPQQLLQQQIVQVSPSPSQSHSQQQQQPSLGSLFHFVNLVENLSDVVENRTRDQNADALISELNSRFDKCQQLLNSISGKIPKNLTVDAQKRKLEESEHLLSKRRDLISTFRKSVEDLTKSGP